MGETQKEKEPQSLALRDIRGRHGVTVGAEAPPGAGGGAAGAGWGGTPLRRRSLPGGWACRAGPESEHPLTFCILSAWCAHPRLGRPWTKIDILVFSGAFGSYLLLFSLFIVKFTGVTWMKDSSMGPRCAIVHHLWVVLRAPPRETPPSSPTPPPYPQITTNHQTVREFCFFAAFSLTSHIRAESWRSCFFLSGLSRFADGPEVRPCCHGWPHVVPSYSWAVVHCVCTTADRHASLLNNLNCTNRVLPHFISK